MRPLLLALMLGGCVSPGLNFKNEIQADGKTWRVTASDPSKCFHYDDDEKCLTGLRPEIDKNAKELCGAAAEKVFACQRRGSVRSVVECMVKCP